MQISLEQNGRQTELGKVTCQTKHVSKRRITELFISFMPVRRGAHYGHNIILATCQYYQKEGPSWPPLPQVAIFLCQLAPGVKNRMEREEEDEDRQRKD